MFVLAYSSSNGNRYMRIVQAVRYDGKQRLIRDNNCPYLEETQTRYL